MNAPYFPRTEISGAAFRANAMFDLSARNTMALHYPEHPHTLRHGLSEHPLMSIDQLAMLGECLPAPSIVYHRADVSIDAAPEPAGNGLSIGETIAQIYTAKSSAALKNIGQAPAYRTLLDDLLGDISAEIEEATGPMIDPQGHIYVSSPDAVSPYRFDAEHCLMLQIRGSKALMQFRAGDTRFAPDEVHEQFHATGEQTLEWDESFLTSGKVSILEEGDAVYVPAMAPHFVQNGPYSSISLAITWGSRWSHAEGEARAMNHWLRSKGLAPNPPHRWPKGNRLKSLSSRALRKLGLT